MADTRMYLDGHSYSLFDPEEIHADLRRDPVQTGVVLRRDPAVAGAHQDCGTCRLIRAEQAADPGAPQQRYSTLDDAIIAHSERSTRVVISRANLARLLGLGPGERVTRMFVTDDPHLLNVVVSGEHYRSVPDGQPTPMYDGPRRR